MCSCPYVYQPLPQHRYNVPIQAPLDNDMYLARPPPLPPNMMPTLGQIPRELTLRPGPQFQV